MSGRNRRYAAMLSVCGVLAMTGTLAAASDQRPRAVVAVSCDAGRSLCQALVQALAEDAPTHIYRLNPDPVPPQAFALSLDLDVAGQARLRWQADQIGASVARDGLTDTDLARQLVTASPALPRALYALPDPMSASE